MLHSKTRSVRWVMWVFVGCVGCGSGAIDVSDDQISGELVGNNAQTANDNDNGDSGEPDQPTCGDGVVEAPEVCDDGAANSDDWTVVARCNTRCTGFAPHCGDGLIDPGSETCDDGAANSDAWSSDGTCNTTCTGPSPSCGDGLVDPDNEACDEGSANSDAWSSAPKCNASCTGPAPYCGDGLLNAANEGCDDGNANEDDGCRSDCVLATCGNGVVEPGEACDEGGVNTADCDADCTAVSCGDGIANAAAGEPCDSSGVATVECDADCTVPECGDGFANAPAGEACDDGPANADSWALAARCNTSCTGFAPHCGDGVVDSANENCDDGNSMTEYPSPATDPDAGYVSTSCTRTCDLDLALCGNGVVDPGEDCDPGIDPPNSEGACTRSCRFSADQSFGAACRIEGQEPGDINGVTGTIIGCDNVPADFDPDCQLGCLQSVTNNGVNTYFAGGFCTLYAMSCEGVGCRFASGTENVGNPDQCGCPPGLARIDFETVVARGSDGEPVVTFRTVVCAEECQTDADCRIREWDPYFSEWGRYECRPTKDGNFCYDIRNQVFIPDPP